jgi:hexosaminidase
MTVTVGLALAVGVTLGVGAGGNGVVTDDDPVEALTVIPVPRSVEPGTGHLHLTDRTRIVVDDRSRTEGELLAESLRPATDLALTVTGDRPRAGDIALAISDDPDPEEAYRLRIDGSGAVITASSTAGLYYGGQTLRQLLPAEIEHSGPAPPPAEGWRLPMLTIHDAPRYPWRGAMLDIARHFFDPAAVITYIDQLAAYKVNRLHLHLTDDQGWRIEIPGWPDLTAVGGRTDIDGGPGGWLSVADYRRIVDHAAARHMTVVPEVDIPGHVNAALAAYGELTATGKPTAIGGETTYGQSTLDPDLPATAPFITEVFTELAAMTPGPYVHLGGDEAFATEPADYRTMIDLAATAIIDGGKIPVGWEEVVAADADGGWLVQHWLGPLNAVRASRAGARVIASPAPHAYLDQKYDEATPIGLSWAGFIDVDTAYRWDPTELDVDPDAIAGVEAPLWTETVVDADDLEFMAFPRMLAIAEVGWSDPRDRDLADHLRRLAAHGPRLTARGIDFYRSPLVDWAPT